MMVVWRVPALDPDDGQPTVFTWIGVGPGSPWLYRLDDGTPVDPVAWHRAVARELAELCPTLLPGPPDLHYLDFNPNNN